jgi:hypothetical protein
MIIHEEFNGMIIGSFVNEPREPQTLAISIPVGLEDFAPQPLVLIPMRWVHRANKMRNGEGGRYILKKLLRSNVGRKFRRHLRRRGGTWGGRSGMFR